MRRPQARTVKTATTTRTSRTPIDAGEDGDSDDDEGIPTAFCEDYILYSDEDMPDHEEGEGESSIEEES